MRFALLALLSRAFLASGSEVVHSVKVGPQTILIPAPAGFERMDGISERQDQVIAELAGTANRQLIMFASPEAVAALRRGEPAASPRNFNAQTLRGLEERALKPADFEALRDQAEKDLGRLGKRLDAVLGKTMEQASKSLSDKFKEAVEFKAGELAPLGVFERTRDSLGFAMLLKTQVTVAGQDTAGLSVVAAMIVRVRERCLYLYATSPRNGDSDEAWVKEAVLRWRDAIFAANDQADAPASSAVARLLQRFDFQAILRAAGVGAVVGALAGLLAMLLRRLQKPAPPAP